MSDKIKFQDLTRLHKSISPELENVFKSVLDTSAFIQGPNVVQFEKDFSAFTGSPYTLGLSNGTDALELALEALDLKAGDVVAVPSLTFTATAEAVVRLGGEPIFVDCDPETQISEKSHFEKAITACGKKVRGIIAVHLHGRSAQIEALAEFAKSKGIFLLEDCAQAHGAKFNGKHVGLFGDIGSFSFYPGKNLGALGDAGAVITNSEKLYSRIKLLRDHGRTSKYFHEYIGRNSRLDGLQAAFLSCKLKHLPAWTANRREIAKQYHHELEGTAGIILPKKPTSEEQHAYHNFVIRVEIKGTKNRDSLMEYLKTKNIETGVHYPLGLHAQPAYKKYASTTFPITDKCVAEILSLPIDPLHSKGDIARVASEVKNWTKL